MEKAIYKTKEAAEYLGVTTNTLEVWRCQGKGPVFLKYETKAVRYRKEDLDSFIEMSLCSNTSKR